MKILLIIPYLGTLPQYFPAFLHSCNMLRGVNILLLTDDSAIDRMAIPLCMKVVKTTFQEIAGRVASISPKARLYSGYKLCDFRPMYGLIFEPECKGYDYWGYCDADTLIGDIPGWLEKVDYQNYDRIGRAGHFTIYRNTPEVNNLWRVALSKTVCSDFVFGTTYPCNFDENGMNEICKSQGVSFLAKNGEANIEPFESLHLKTYGHVCSSENLCEIFTWEQGHTYMYRRESSEIHKTEVSYIHYSSRKQMPIHDPLDDMVLITHEGFYHFDANRLEEYLDNYGRKDTPEEYEAFTRAQKKHWKQWRRNKMIFEFKTLGLVKALSNIIWRFNGLSLRTLLMRTKK